LSRKLNSKGIIATAFLFSIMLFSQQYAFNVSGMQSNQSSNEISLNSYYNYWSPAIEISEGSTILSLRPEVAVDPFDNVHIIWSDAADITGTSSSDWDVFHRYWNETTTSWSSIELVSVGSSGASEAPRIVADELGNLHAVWFDWPADSDINYAFWDVQTQTWGVPEEVDLSSTQNSLWPDIAVKNGDVFLVWQDLTNMLGAGSDHDLFFKRRFSNGTWSSTELITTESNQLSRFPSIFVDDAENVYVSWDDETDYAGAGADLDVFFKMRDATTGSWSTTEVISAGLSVKHQRSKIVVDNEGNRHIVWFNFTQNTRDFEEDKDIFYRMWNDTLSSWGGIEIVSTESDTRSEVPEIILDDEGNVHCFWFDRIDYDGTGVDTDIFYKVRNVDTNNWQNLTLITPNNYVDTWRPVAAMDSQKRIHLVWQDGIRTGDVDVIYSYGIDTFSNMELSLIDSPEDLVYEINTTSHSLSWTLQDDNVSSTFYTITRNGTEVQNGSWNSLEAFSLNVDNLGLGVYEYLLNATDGYGNYLQDIVYVSVVTDLPSNFDFDFVVNVAFGAIIATTVVLFSMAFTRRKRK